VHKRGKSDGQFLVLTCGGEPGDCLVVELTGALHLVDTRNRATEIAKPGRLAQDLIGHRGKNTGKCHIATIGKCSALILRQLADHAGVAALDQNVGDGR